MLLRFALPCSALVSLLACSTSEPTDRTRDSDAPSDTDESADTSDFVDTGSHDTDAHSADRYWAGLDRALPMKFVVQRAIGRSRHVALGVSGRETATSVLEFVDGEHVGTVSSGAVESSSKLRIRPAPDCRTADVTLPDRRATRAYKTSNPNEITACSGDANPYRGYPAQLEGRGPAMGVLLRLRLESDGLLRGQMTLGGDIDHTAEITPTIENDGTLYLGSEADIPRIYAGWSWSARITHDYRLSDGELVNESAEPTGWMFYLAGNGACPEGYRAMESGCER